MGKLNVVLDWFANTNHTGFLLAEKRGYFAEAGLEVHIDGEVHGVMDLHGADFVLGPQISMLDCMSRGVELTGVAVLTQRSDSGIVSLKESGITSPGSGGQRLTHWAPRWFHGVIGEAVRLDGGDYGKVELVPMDVGDIVATLGTVADATWVYANWENEELIAAGKEINFINLADVDPLFDFCAPAVAATHQVLRDPARRGTGLPGRSGPGLSGGGPRSGGGRPGGEGRPARRVRGHAGAQPEAPGPPAAGSAGPLGRHPPGALGADGRLAGGQRLLRPPPPHRVHQ